MILLHPCNNLFLYISISDCNVRNYIDQNRDNDESDMPKKNCDCDDEQMTQTKNCTYQEKANVSPGIYIFAITKYFYKYDSFEYIIYFYFILQY